MYIDSLAHFLKIRIHRCYINKFNLYNQVGIVAINVLGEGVPAGSPAANLMSPSGMVASPLAPTGGHSLPPSMNSPPSYAQQQQQPADLSFDSSFPPQAANMLKAIVAAKERAVNGEDFDLAANLKASERDIMTVATKLSAVESAKRAAVMSEDYEKAKSLKGDLDTLRAEVQEAIDKVTKEVRSEKRSAAATNSNGSF